MRMLTIPAMLALVLTAPPVACGEVATALLIEGHDLPGLPPTEAISAVNNSAVNHAGGYAFTVGTTGIEGSLARAWGNATGGAGTVLRSEGTFGDYEQTSWEAFFGFADDGAVAYSPLCTNLITGQTGLDAVWLDDAIVAIEEDPYPHAAGYWWSFASRPGVTANGLPYFVGGLSDVPGGATDLRGLFFGADANPALLGGDFTGGIPDPVSAQGIDFDVRYSALGTHWIDVVIFNTGNTANDNYVLLDGNPVTFGSPDLLREGNAVPAGIGGLPGELWANFDFLGVTEDGLILVTGDTNAAVGVDEFVLLGSQIVLREGGLTGGSAISGDIEGGYLNADGDWAVIWSVLVDGGVIEEALIINGELVLKGGDAVDMDGDGVVEASSILDVFTGISSLTLGDRDAQGIVRAYFTADVDAILLAASGSEPAFEGDLAAAGLEDIPVEERGDRVVVEAGFVLPFSTATGAGDVPAANALRGSYPNPFNPSTRVAFTLARAEEVRLEVITPGGRHVATLLAGELPAGQHEAVWTGRDDEGQLLASGVYLARLTAGSWEATSRMVLLK